MTNFNSQNSISLYDRLDDLYDQLNECYKQLQVSSDYSNSSAISDTGHLTDNQNNYDAAIDDFNTYEISENINEIEDEINKIYKHLDTKNDKSWINSDNNFIENSTVTYDDDLPF